MILSIYRIFTNSISKYDHETSDEICVDFSTYYSESECAAATLTWQCPAGGGCSGRKRTIDTYICLFLTNYVCLLSLPFVFQIIYIKLHHITVLQLSKVLATLSPSSDPFNSSFGTQAQVDLKSNSKPAKSDYGSWFDITTTYNQNTFVECLHHTCWKRF